MSNISTSVLMYFIFSIFVFYQQLHVKTFNGSSPQFRLALVVSATTGMLTGLVYLGYLLWQGAWIAMLSALIGGLLVTPLIGIAIERLIGKSTLSMAAFIGWPISAFFMFRCA